MWKCATRSLKATFRKRVLRRSTVLCTKSPQSSNSNYLSKNSPAFLEYFNRYYGYYKSTCEKFSQEKNDKGGPREKKSSFLNFDSNIFDALRWSGAFVLGCYFLQPFTKKRSPHYNCYGNPAYSKLSGYQQTVEYVINSLGVQPFNYVLPEVKAPKFKEFTEKQSDECWEQNSKSDKFSSLGKAHQKVLGTLNNWMGVQCIESGKHKQAFKYFKQAAAEENTAGIFNLGICHEKGLGTSQNYNEAAEFYQKAADLGHPTAMYNLGIFYIQGLGGVEPDLDHARELFEEAAKLGQPDAEKALNIGNNKSSNAPENNSNQVDLAQEDEGSMTAFICDTLIKHTSLSSLENCSMCDSVESDKYESFEYSEDEKQSLNSDSGVLDLFSQNKLDISSVPVT